MPGDSKASLSVHSMRLVSACFMMSAQHRDNLRRPRHLASVDFVRFIALLGRAPRYPRPPGLTVKKRVPLWRGSSKSAGATGMPASIARG